MEVFNSKYGTWRKLNEESNAKFELRWWRDLWKVCNKKVRG